MGLRRRVWETKIDDQEHVIELSHGYWSGRREIRVDGSIVYQGRRLFDVGSGHTFGVHGHECTLRIAYGLLGFRYGLRIDEQVVLPSQEYYDCERVDWVFTPRTLGDYLAQTSYSLGRVICAVLIVQLLALFGGSVIGLVLLHFAAVYAAPAPICVLAGSIALLLPSPQREVRTVRARKGIIFGLVMLVWSLFLWVVIVPEMSQAL
jgi:hypothetical protein